MKLVVFGLAVSSSWGNGHATLWRGLCRALAARGHDVAFFERDVPYYAGHRDVRDLPGGGRLYLYETWEGVCDSAVRELSDADAAMVTSFCPDALAAEALMLESCEGLHIFYDLDTPITLDRIGRGLRVDYLGPDLLANYDLALSYTGGESLRWMHEQLGARQAAPLYGSVDPDAHQPQPASHDYHADLSYIGTYSADRQDRLDDLFLEPARRLPSRRFTLAGSQYPDDFSWPPNVFYKRHLEPARHPVFYSSSRLTLNVTRRAMAETGYCPSGRLFEAAACGAPLLSDSWTGLNAFFEPGREILVASTTDEALDAIARPDGELARMAARARDRVLAEHTAAHRAQELEEILRGIDVGHHSGRGRRHANSTAGVL